MDIRLSKTVVSLKSEGAFGKLVDRPPLSGNVVGAPNTRAPVFNSISY